MRNLLGRLNAREPDELGRIAAAWQIAVSGGDKLGQVAQLYQAMTDLRSGRDLWGRLPEDERELVRVLALTPGQEQARPLATLAMELGLPEAEVRRIAVRLYHKGILAREGDDDPLPVGEAPRLFLPRELSTLFRRVQDEIESGDISATPLRTLLALLDDREVEEAAEAWGIRVIPGIRTRGEIVQALLGQVGQPERLADVQSKLKRDAAKIWERINDVNPSGAPLPYTEAHLATGLNPEQPRDAQRLRKALAELEEALLVWHTYHADGSRWLFTPVDIRVPGGVAGETAAPPATVATGEMTPQPRHPHAVAWDLLTLLRSLAPPQDRPIYDLGAMPRPWLRQLNEQLWNRGTDGPPSGYLDFLVDLARVEGVLTGGDPAVEEPFQVSTSVRQWRSRSFPEQTARLRATWLGSSTWIEGGTRDDVDVEGADWAGFRLKLVNHLHLLSASAFHGLDEVAGWLAGRDPGMLGAHFTVATARRIEVAGDPAATRRAAIAEVAIATLESGFVWFGLVELVAPRGQPRLLRVTPALGALGPDVPPAPSDGATPALIVSEAGRIRLRAPSPLRVWSLSAFASLLALGEESEYELSEASIARALRAGFEPRDIEAFLTNQSGSALPADVQARLRDWSQRVRRVRVIRTIQLIPDDPAELEALAGAVMAAGFEAVAATDGVLVTMTESGEPSPAELALSTRLREAGFTLHGAPAVRRAVQRDRRS